MRFIIHLCVYMCTGNDVTTCTWTYIPNYLLSKHERKTKTNLFWHVKFICFHLISATSIDKTAQLLMDNRQDLHFDNEYKIFAIKRFQLKLVKSFPMPLCVSTTDTLCHWNIVRFYRTELCKQGTSDNATTESDYIVFILQRNGSISTTSRHGNHHTFTSRIARWQRRSPWPEALSSCSADDGKL